MYKYSPLPMDIVLGSQLIGESKDCSVKALAIALGTSYRNAHRHLEVKCGRARGRGIMSSQVLPRSLKNTPYREGPYSRLNKVSISRFCREHPKGRFYIAVSGHAIAVVDGVVFDTVDAPRRMVKWAIRLYPKGVD